MRETGLTAHGLSQRANLGKGVVGAILSGQTRHVRAGTIAKIAAALGVPASYLSGDTSAPDEQAGAEPWTAEADPCPVTRAAVKAALAARAGLRAFVAGPGADGLGVPRGARVIVDSTAGDTDGAVLAVQIPGKGVAIRYRAKPYWIGVSQGRGATDLDGPGLRILGQVVAAVIPFESNGSR